MNKRVLIALTVPEDTDNGDLATELDVQFPAGDATVWEWDEFWKDAEGDFPLVSHAGGDQTCTTYMDGEQVD